MADYLDLTEAELIAWFQNWAAKLAVHEPTITALTVADVVQGAADSVEVESAVTTVLAIRSDKQEYTQTKNLMLHAVLGTALPVAPTATAWPAFGLGAAAAMKFTGL